MADDRSMTMAENTRPTDDDLAQWKRLTAEATEGPWEAVGTGVSGGDHWYVCADHEAIVSISSQDGSNEDERQPLADFIAVSRTAVPALIAEVEALRAERDAALARIEKVREVHYPAHNNQDHTPFCETCKGAPGVHECGCWQDEQQEPVCGHCRGWKGVGPIEWPCDTLRALDGGEEGA